MSKYTESEQEFVVRAPLPKEEQLLGFVEKLLGCRRMYVKCSDGELRNCRVPGRHARRLWIRPRDIVMVELWEINKEKANVIYKYRTAQINWLRKRGHLKFLE